MCSRGPLGKLPDLVGELPPRPAWEFEWVSARAPFSFSSSPRLSAEIQPAVRLAPTVARFYVSGIVIPSLSGPIRVAKFETYPSLRKKRILGLAVGFESQPLY